MNISLLKNLDFASKINKTDAVSEAGKEMLQNYRAYIYSNPSSCGIVNGFVHEAKNFSFDAGLVSILNSVQSYINENKVSWALASACESIVNKPSHYNYIATVGVEKVQKLLEMNMNESDLIGYIKGGALRDLTFVPEFRQICQSVYGSSVNETKTAEYTISYPISFVHVNEHNEQFFNVLGKTFKNSNGVVSEAVCDIPQFKRVNMLLESFKKENDIIFYEHRGAHGDVAKFELSEEGLTFTKGEIKESFKTPIAFAEYCNTMSRIMPMNEKVNWMNVTAAIGEVFEAYDSIVVVDNAAIMTSNNGTVCSIIEGKDNVNLAVFRSVNAGTSCTNYEYISEALKAVTSLTGVDLSSRYNDRINEDIKAANSEEYTIIKEQLDNQKQAEMAERKKKIAMLAEQYKNDPVKIALLNKAAQDLAMLEN